MKYEIRILKQGFLGKDKIDIPRIIKGSDLQYGLFDDFGVLEKGKYEEGFALFYQTEDSGSGVFLKNQINEKTHAGEVLLTVNERLSEYELYSNHFLFGKLIDAVKEQFYCVKIYENDTLITEEDFLNSMYFGKDYHKYKKNWEAEFKRFAKNTDDGFVQGPLFPLFLDKDGLKDFTHYSCAIVRSVNFNKKYTKREFFTDSHGKKKSRWFLEANTTALLPGDRRTVKDIWKTSAVMNLEGKDLPYNMVIDELAKTENLSRYDRRLVEYKKLSVAIIKKIARSVEKRLSSEQFPDFNFKLAVIAGIMGKDPSFKEKYDDDILDYAKDSHDSDSDYLSSDVEKFFKELVLTKSDLEKVTHLSLVRENDFFFELKPNWKGEDSLFDIESFKGINLLPNLKTYSYDGLICAPELIEELGALERISDGR